MSLPPVPPPPAEVTSPAAAAAAAPAPAPVAPVAPAPAAATPPPVHAVPAPAQAPAPAPAAAPAPAPAPEPAPAPAAAPAPAPEPAPAPAAAPAPAPEPAPAPAAAPAPTQAVVPAAPPEPDTDKQLAPAQAPQAPVAYSGVPEAAGMAAQAAEDGFEGLSFDGFGTFPLIVLDLGTFRYSDGTEIGSEFVCTMLRSRPKFLYKTNLPKPERGDDPNEVVYSYDGETSTSGVPLEEIFADWRSKNLPMASQPTRYVEVTAQMEGTDAIVLLSVSQASIPPLSQYWANVRHSGRSLKEVRTRVFRGRKVERVANPYFPWAFAMAD